jgi:oxygen-independent coproporphyrinogen-3 oxidase
MRGFADMTPHADPLATAEGARDHDRATGDGLVGADEFAIYVHWPFCRSKCPYCDFNSHVREAIDEARWRAAILSELDHYAGETRGRTVSSIFFGGGTPSLMAPATVASIIARIAGRWRLATDVEITLEANPNSAERAKFTALRGAGVNRLSLGVQSLDDKALRFLGRAHDSGEARAAIAAAADTFERFSFDLIYARPGQSVAAWRDELAAALALAGEHLSLYQLTIEQGTAFHALHQRGDIVLPPEDEAAAFYEVTQEVLTDAGLPAYEISNHARPGAECRHNLVYWRYGDYAGIGPGAHGRLTRNGARIATRQERAPETWLAAVEARGHGTAEGQAIAPAHAAEEALMMGLRLSEGIDPARFQKRTGVALDAALDQRRLQDLIAGGFLIGRADGGVAATPAGRRVLNAITAALLV